jgi:glutathione S-transferase
VAKANKLELDVVTVDTANPTAEYLKYNKLGKVPTFVGSDGYVLSECIAIAIYRESIPKADCAHQASTALSHDDEIDKSFSYPCLKFLVLTLF